MSYIMDLRSLVGSRPLIVIGACVLILDSEGKLLLLRRSDNNRWGLPGGSMEPGETLAQAASREVQEEAGVTNLALKFLHVFSGPDLYHVYPNGDQAYIVTSAFCSHTFTGVACVADNENTEIGFFPINKLPEDLSPPSKIILDYFLRNPCGC